MLMEERKRLPIVKDNGMKKNKPKNWNCIKDVVDVFLVNAHTMQLQIDKIIRGKIGWKMLVREIAKVN